MEAMEAAMVEDGVVHRVEDTVDVEDLEEDQEGVVEHEYILERLRNM